MRFLILFFISLPAFALSQKDFSMGVGLETRAGREVNPDYVTPKNSGMFFAKLQQHSWAVLLEAARNERDSRSGALHVSSESTRVAAWGRYEFPIAERSWSPFASAGAGMYFDKVTTSFAQSNSSRSGRRGLLGLGGGISALIWDHLALEAEARLESVELARDPEVSAVFRLGCQM